MSSSIGGRRSAAVTFVTAVATIALAVSLASCSPSDPVDGVARSTAAFNLIVDAVADAEFGVVNEGEPLPVIYVTSREEKVPFDVQVSVAATHVDLLDLRFADSRSEAIDEGLDDLPVRDGGVLVVVGPVPDTGRRIEVDLEVYRDRSRVDTGRAVVRWRDGAWTLEQFGFDEP